MQDRLGLPRFRMPVGKACDQQHHQLLWNRNDDIDEKIDIYGNGDLDDLVETGMSLLRFIPNP